MNGYTRIGLRGVLAGSAYLLAQAIDLNVTGNKVDDRMLLGGVAPLSPSQCRTLGTAIHLANSVIVSFVYTSVVEPRLQGPGWWKGIVFANLENAMLYALTFLEDFHPAIRDGRLDSYQSKTAFLQGVWRHTWFGAILGALNRR